MPLKAKRILFFLLPFFLQACAIQQGKINSLAEGLEHSSSEATLAALQEIAPPDRDRAQYLLNIGLLKSITGDFSGATKDLQAAKELINTLQAASVSEGIGAATINETLRSYDGGASERVLLHELMSINYLMLNDLDAARVEVLQASVVMAELASADKLIGQLASSHYIAGLVYELGGELDNAMISYRKTEKIMTARSIPLPIALKHSLLSLSQYLGLDADYEKYNKQFGLSVKTLSPDAAEIIVIYWDGVVSSKKEKSLSVWVPSLDQVVSLALPSYPQSNYVKKSLSLNFGGQHYLTATLEDIETLMREDLDDESALTYSIALARMIAKVEMVQSAGQQNGSLGLLMNIATLLTESADIRSWNMLPSSIQIARFTLPQGQYPLPLAYYSGSTQMEEKKAELTVNAGDKIVLFVPAVSHRIFSYTLSSGRKFNKNKI